MGSGIRPRLSYSNVIATLALFIALGGGAYALSLGRGDVRSKHIARDAVKSKHVKDGQVGTSDLGDAAVTGSKIAAGVIPKASYAGIATAESTTSPTNTDLATPGPNVTVNVPADAFVGLTVSTEASAPMGAGCGTAITSPALPEDALATSSGGGSGFQQDTKTVVRRVAPGTHSFTLRYRKTAGGVADACTFRNRALWVEVVAP